MGPLRYILRTLFHFLVVWIVDTISLIVTAAILPGFVLTTPSDVPRLAGWAGVALVLGVVNLLIRPLILLLALPLGFFVVFAIGFIANAVALLITSAILPNFQVNDLITALIGGIILGAVNAILSSIISLDDDDSFYQGVIERLAKRQSFKDASESGLGLVMLEVDGLSYHHIQKAIAEGWMPTLKKLMQEQGYQISRVDCGLPSQTSACQAGIMFGDNFDIPSFRWFDKGTNKLYVSGSDAAELNQRYAHGQGLMRGGSSINNMLNGDAEKSLLTFANLRTGSPEEKRKRAEDIYLLMLNPYFFMRTIALFIGDVILELWQAFQQRRKNVQPRLDRLHKFYPFVRASTTVFMRDIEMNLAMLDIVRGSPSIYVTYCGYDEVAHHSGPWTTDAFGTLKQFDRQVARILDVIERKAPRPYELIILSDHGQSFGATFKQRYGHGLKEFIEGHSPEGTKVLHSAGGDDGTLSVTSMAAELDNVQQQGMGGAVGRSVVKQTERALNRAVEQQTPATATAVVPKETNLVVCGSGNIAQVYVDLAPRKLRVSELNAAFPGVVDALVQHEGIGFVVGYDDDDEPIAFGRKGARNLHTGDVTGDDPLKPYAGEHSPVELRAEQVRRVADFPHSGDLIVNSAVFPDGTVAAMEELIGNHGGIGGEQTDAFIFHPSELQVPLTKNSADVFNILNARRGLPAPPPKPQPQQPTGIDAWSPSVLASGLSRVSAWLSRAASCIVLDRRAYRAVATDAYMTGPALVIALAACVIASVVNLQRVDLLNIVLRFVLWLVAVLVAHGAAKLLRGTGNFTMTFRGMGFGLSAFVIQLLAFIPALGPVARFVAVALGLFGTWFGAVEAHQLRGWRTIIFPVIAGIVFVVGAFLLYLLVTGAQFALGALLNEFGLTPQ